MRVHVLLVLAAAALATQRRAPPLPTDPATDLARVRVFLTTTASGLDLTLDGATLASARVTAEAGVPTVRATTGGSVLHVTGNEAGASSDLRVDMVLANVMPGARVGWTVALFSSGHATLDVRNFNGSAPVAVDRFETDGPVARFETRSDLLRNGALFGPVPNTGTHLVVAFFYPWYDLTTWSSPELADRPLQRYSTDDASDLARIMGQAKGAGLDALAVSWQGRDFEGGWNHRRMLGCLAAADRAGLRIATLLETTVANPQHEQTGVAPDPDTVLAWLVDIVDDYGSHPAYLRVDGRPVVFAYAAQRLTEPRWIEVLDRLRAGGRDVFLVGEGRNDSRLDAFDGQFVYASSEFGGDQIRSFDREQSLGVRTYHLLPEVRGGRRVWAATVSPGYDDTRLADGRTPHRVDRDDGRFYDGQWQSALDMAADWIVVTSWNEWWENTEIEPGEVYGDLYVTRTREWASRFRQLRHQAVPRTP
jgi:hypothetical protein